MDDSCAVCAESLDWVAYGACGHREVCSTCIIRLRFVCNDKCCCICKCQSDSVFVTKALGDYTKVISDFSDFPVDSVEGQVGKYWFHEGSRAYFDDLDHYKMIKAMCKLSCNVCEKKNELKNNGVSKRIGDFSSVDQLKIHLFHQHKLFMCSLCLEGRKIFISEQKLYNRAQLNQHVKTGDSVIDGSESERGGFMGHPICEFCQNPFYGDNELYMHMSTEHFTCHMCQRRNPGQYEYYKDYDDLESHFRGEHFLCEDETCLAKKFIVFPTESEMKRHDAMEHGGRMSRSKRNSVLQIPTSFRYQCQDQRGRGRGMHNNSSDIQLSGAIQDNLETLNAVRLHDNSSAAQTISSRRERRELEPTVNPFGLLATSDSEPLSRYNHVSRQNSATALMEESSFPPLPLAPSSSRQMSGNAVGSSGNTMAARLRHRNTVKVLHSSRTSLAPSNHSNLSANTSYQSRPAFHSGPSTSSSSPVISKSKRVINDNTSSSNASFIRSGSSTANELVSSVNRASSSRTQSSTRENGHLPSAPDAKNGSLEKININFLVDDAATVKLPQMKIDVQSANKALVEKIRAALNFDEEKFAAFKVVSKEYRQDLIETAEYLAYVHQFGLSHLVFELALLCPNPQKQKELVEIHKHNSRRNGSNENSLSINNDQQKNKKSSKKGKERCEEDGNCSSGNSVAGNLRSGIINLEVNNKCCLEETRTLSKPSSNSAKGKSKVSVDQEANRNLRKDELRSETEAQPGNGSSVKNVGAGGEGNKPRKKMSKFLKNRLGESSTAESQANGNFGAGDDGIEEKTYKKKHPPEILPVHGVWRNGGGRRLVVMAERNCKR